MIIMSKRVIIFVGPPGSGKGTQSDLLGDSLGIPKIDVGSLLRQRAKSPDETGKTIHRFQNEGKMIPDDMLEPVIEPVIQKQPNKGFILDGYCRNIQQVQHVFDWEKKGIFKEPIVINLNVNTNTTLKRIKQRRFCATCNEIRYVKNDDQTTCDTCHGILQKREDDNVDTFKKRVVTYKQQALPAQKLLADRYKYIVISGEQPIEDVHRNIKKEVTKLWV